MARVRFVRSARDQMQSDEAPGIGTRSRAHLLRAVYETDAEVVHALVPRPLEATRDPCIHVSIARLWRGEGAVPVEDLRVACLSVRVAYDGEEGIHPIAMQVTSEQAMTVGREGLGLPIKTARIELDAGDELVSGRVERRGISFLGLSGRRLEEVGACDESLPAFTFKAFPSCEKPRGFDQDPRLLRLDGRVRLRARWRLEGVPELAESPFDPVVDLPVRRVVAFEYGEGEISSQAKVLRPVPGDWLLPYIHQRYDSPEDEGLEV